MACPPLVIDYVTNGDVSVPENGESGSYTQGDAPEELGTTYYKSEIPIDCAISLYGSLHVE